MYRCTTVICTIFLWVNFSEHLQHVTAEQIANDPQNLSRVLPICSDAKFSQNKTAFVPKEFVKLTIKEISLNRIEFRLSDERIRCKGENATFQVSLDAQNATHPVFLSNGYLKFNESYYSPEEFCIVGLQGTTIQLKICHNSPAPSCSLDTPCIRKCCEIDELLDLTDYAESDTFRCRAIGQSNWRPEFYTDQSTKIPSQENVKIRILPHHPRTFCSNKAPLLLNLRPFASQPVYPFRLLPNGSVLEQTGRRSWTEITGDHACVDHAQNFPEINGKFSGPSTGRFEDTVVVDCRLEVDEASDEGQSSNFEDIWTVIYVIAFLIAIIFLLATLMAHIVLWKKQTVRGWTLMGYVTSLTVEFAFLIFARLIPSLGTTCTAVAIGTHFAVLATFGWLTVMNFDVWWCFRSMNPVISRRAQIKTFIWYVVVVDAIPTCIVSVGLILDHAYRDYPFGGVITPEYGRVKCGLGTSGEFPYLFGPISFLLLCNLLFLCATLYLIRKNQKILKSSGIKTTMLNDKIQFFGRLFLIAGITWIFDVISWATTPPNAETPWYWRLFDFVNIFQAVAIFLIFVCNRNTLTSLGKEIPWITSVTFLCLRSNEDQTKPCHPNTQPCSRCSDLNKDNPACSRKLSLTQIFSITEPNKNNMELL